MSKIINCNPDNYHELETAVKGLKVKRLFLVHGKSAFNLPIYQALIKIQEEEEIQITEFTEFEPNPKYESVVRGVQLYLKEDCEAVIAVGGGSAIDVAKCIKVFSNMNHHINYLHQDIQPDPIPLLAVPTTAGTGSESTCFAVIYYNGEKQSVEHRGCLPDTVFLDASVLTGLPGYQRKVTMLDALCHAVESYWSVHSTKDSRALSAKAIRTISEYMDAYLNNTSVGNEQMLYAANLAGQAINITKTTAPHAMSYKLTSLFGCAHGQAAGMCLPLVWKYMLSHLDRCTDARGESFVQEIFDEIAGCLKCDSADSAVRKIQRMYDGLALPRPCLCMDEQIELLVKSVNMHRLKNNPVELVTDAVREIYQNI